MAEILNVARSTYSGWENDIRYIPLTKLNDFCIYFNLSLDYICKLSKTKQCPTKNTQIDKIIVGKNLRYIRTLHKDTQKYVANMFNVNRSNYSKYETGKILIPTLFIIEFAKHYKVSIDWICGKTK